MSLFERREKWILFILAFIQFSHIVDFMIMMPLGPQLMRIFEITPKQFGLLVSAYTFAAGTTGILSAFFMDRYDRKKSLLFFYVGFCIGTIACALSPTYEMLLIARTITGAFGGVLGSLTLAIVGDVISPDRRGTAVGIVMGSFSLASIFGVPFGLFLANHFNWHFPFMFLGVLSFALTGVIARFLPPVRKHLDNPSRENPWHVVLGILQDPSPRLAILFMMLLMFSQFLIIPFLSQSMVANAGLAEIDLPFIYLVGGTASFFAAPFVGRMADRFGMRLVFNISAALCLIPVFLITNLSVSPTWVVLTYSALFFICATGRTIPAMALVTSTVLPQRRGSFMSLVSSVQQFGGAIASLISGLIVVRSAEGHLSHYEVVGYISIGMSLVAILAAQKIRVVE